VWVFIHGLHVIGFLIRMTVGHGYSNFTQGCRKHTHLAALVARLGDSDAEVRLVTVQALGAVGGRLADEHLTALVAGLGDVDRDVRQAAAQALGQVGDWLTAEHLAALVAWLGNSEMAVRRAAVEVLTVLGQRRRLGPELVGQIEAYLRDHRNNVREDVYRALKLLYQVGVPLTKQG
jgi:HEAT repeat protein